MLSSRQVTIPLFKLVRTPGAFAITEWLFLRALGLVYLSAFASLWPQILGLMGSRGVAPCARLLEAMHSGLGAQAFYYAPSLFWLNPSDSMLIFLCVTGCLFSILLALNWFSRIATIGCFVLYLSLSSIGQPFLSFQWDALLLETGFLAIFSGAASIVWAYRLLLFRLMFESGWVKLASHDPNWRNLHALRFHFMTQPLPNPIAYYVYRAPAGLLDTATAVTLAIELGAPFLLFCPGLLRRIGAGLLIALQILILLTGNYAFFNLLTLALCLWGFDARIFTPLSRALARRFPRPSPFWRRHTFHIIGNIAVLVMIALGALQLLNSVAPRTPFVTAKPLAWLQPFEIVNPYGLFAIMTTTRTEIVIEGSNDQVNWREYEFPYKPGNRQRGLPWIAPYQPRLDWQMWFAALGDYQSNSWVGGLMYRILTGESSVLRLLDPPPFAQPPHYLRALAYRYDFTTLDERARTGAVWKRQLAGIWFGPVSLSGR
jgi:hypothetical protein